MIKEAIRQKIATIELEYKVEVLYACESGSRAWGFASNDSDYDVRFIYKHGYEDYLSISPPKDTIDCPLDGNKLDFVGWDIKKALGLLNQSNASVFEWLQSPIIYINNGSFSNRLWDIALNYASPRTLIRHYLGVMKSAYQSGLKKDQMNVKKYFYVLRPLLAAMWIRDYGQPAPIDFDTLLKKGTAQKPKIAQIIEGLLEIKKKGNESDIATLNLDLELFIEEESTSCERLANRLLREGKSTNALDSFFRDTIKKPLSSRNRLSL